MVFWYDCCWGGWHLVRDHSSDSQIKLFRFADQNRPLSTYLRYKTISLGLPCKLLAFLWWSWVLITRRATYASTEWLLLQWPAWYDLPLEFLSSPKLLALVRVGACSTRLGLEARLSHIWNCLPCTCFSNLMTLRWTTITYIALIWTNDEINGRHYSLQSSLCKAPADLSVLNFLLDYLLMVSPSTAAWFW